MVGVKAAAPTLHARFSRSSYSVRRLEAPRASAVSNLNHNKGNHTMLMPRIAALAAALTLSAVSFAQPPADAPAGTTGLCKDGTYSSNATKKGACSGHKGVKEWYAPAAGTAAAGSAAPQAPATSTTPATKTTTASPAASSATAPAAGAAMTPKSTTTPAPAATAAPGGGPGKVWVNTSTKTYHCPSDRWYGKTKAGEYLTEADAKSQGFHAAYGKTCGQ